MKKPDTPMQNHKILSKKMLNHNVIQIELEALGLDFPTSSFVYIYDNKNNCRPYTPIRVTKRNSNPGLRDKNMDKSFNENNSLYNDKEINYEPFKSNTILTFAIKIYPSGTLSPYINSLKIGDTLKLGPVINKIKFDKKWRNVLMIAGGTGITPMLQIIESEKESSFVVVFCNLTRNDVFLSSWLERDNVEVFHVIEKEENGVGGDMVDKKKIGDKNDLNGDKDDLKSDEYDSNENKCDMKRDERDIKISYYGKINKKILSEIIEKRRSFDKIFICGPDGMLEAVCGKKNLDKSQGELKGILKEMGFTEDDVYKF